MIERRPFADIASHAVLIVGCAVVVLPVWLAFVASTRPGTDLMSGVLPILPGGSLVENYATILNGGLGRAGVQPIRLLLFNSMVMAIGIAVGKIVISLLSAFAVVYFRFPFRTLAFWVIFLTLMLPVEVRILPTYEVVAGLGLLNSYTGLILPLIASATATFLFRQVFLTVPDELVEAARIDGAGPLRFFVDILVPMSRTNIAAVFIILFVYGWNQYLWPLLVTDSAKYATVVVAIQRMVQVSDAEPLWHLAMATAILALLPPALVIILMQKLFVRGLVDAEK